MARAAVYVLVLAMVCSTALARTPKKGTLEVTIFGPVGFGSGVAVVPNAHVVLRWNYAGEPMCWNDGHCPKTTNPHKKVLQIKAIEGTFSVPLVPGVWDVFAYRNGFAPTCTQVSVAAGKTTSVKLQFPGLAPQSQE